METEQATPAAASKEAKKGPVKVFHADDVSASVFRHEHQMRRVAGVFLQRHVHSLVSRQRRSEQVCEELRFGRANLGKVVSVAQQADVYIRDLLHPTAEQ